MIRRATKQDFNSIYELGSYLHADYKKVNHLDFLINESVYKFFVADVDEKVVAFLSITEFYEVVDIVDLFVLPDYRGKHLASCLLNYMLGDISDQVEYLTLEVACNNAIAIQLYRNFGFEVVNKRIGYYSDQDAYLMGKRCIRE